MLSTLLTNTSHWVQGNNWSFTGIHRQYQKIFSRIWQFFDVIFRRICRLSAAWFFRVLLEANFGHICCQRWTHCLGTPLETRSRPLGVRVCPVAQFNFFSTAFNPRAWTVVFSFHLRQLKLSSMILKFFLVHKVHSPPAHFLDHHVLPDSPCVPPGWPPAQSLAGSRKRAETGSGLRERLHPRPSPPEPRLIPVPMGDGEYDDQPPQ